jgi:hypothetical protein
VLWLPPKAGVYYTLFAAANQGKIEQIRVIRAPHLIDY